MKYGRFIRSRKFNTLYPLHEEYLVQP
jgi:hypothetical protein